MRRSAVGLSSASSISDHAEAIGRAKAGSRRARFASRPALVSGARDSSIANPAMPRRDLARPQLGRDEVEDKTVSLAGPRLFHDGLDQHPRSRRAIHPGHVLTVSRAPDLRVRTTIGSHLSINEPSSQSALGRSLPNVTNAWASAKFAVLNSPIPGIGLGDPRSRPWRQASSTRTWRPWSRSAHPPSTLLYRQTSPEKHSKDSCLMRSAGNRSSRPRTCSTTSEIVYRLASSRRSCGTCSSS